MDIAITQRWKAMQDAEKGGIKNYLVNKIISLSRSENSLKQHRALISKMNHALVAILKFDWPAKWPTFAVEMVKSAKGNEILCENNVNILQLLGEEVFDFQEIRWLDGESACDEGATQERGRTNFRAFDPRVETFETWWAWSLRLWKPYKNLFLGFLFILFSRRTWWNFWWADSFVFHNFRERRWHVLPRLWDFNLHLCNRSTWIRFVHFLLWRWQSCPRSYRSQQILFVLWRMATRIVECSFEVWVCSARRISRIILR